MLEFSKLIDTIITSISYLKFNENNEFDSAAIPPTIFSMAAIFEIQYFWLRK